jgi:hypothetical protein
MTRGIPTDLTGHRFGNLHVVRRDGRDAQNNALWSCECDCGNKFSIRVGNLRRGQRFCTKQCPLYQATIRIDILGQRFGGLVAIERLRMAPNSGKAVWQFRCDCGVLAELTADNAISGNTTSCGCIGKASRIKHGKSQTREYHRDANRRWAAQNPAKVIANANKRRADFERRIPPWLTAEHWEQINAFYLEAARLTKETGIPHCVDHKHPLRGKLISGLHVPWNLQVMTQAENLRKSARLIDDIC